MKISEITCEFTFKNAFDKYDVIHISLTATLVNKTVLEATEELYKQATEASEHILAYKQKKLSPVKVETSQSNSDTSNVSSGVADDLPF